MGLFEVDFKKIFNKKLSPMDKIKEKVKKHDVSDILKKERESIFSKDKITSKEDKIIHTLLLSCFFLFPLLFSIGTSLLILALFLKISFIHDNFLLLSIMCSFLVYLLVIIDFRVETKYYKQQFDYYLTQEDIIEYATNFSGDKQEHVIKNLVYLTTDSGDARNFANFEHYKDYIENEEKKLYDSLTPEQEIVVKCIQGKIEQDENKTIIEKEKEKVHCSI